MRPRCRRGAMTWTCMGRHRHLGIRCSYARRVEERGQDMVAAGVKRAASIQESKEKGTRSSGTRPTRLAIFGRLCARRFAFTRQRQPIAFLTDAKVDFASLDNFESDDEESTKPHKQLSPAQLRFSTKSESAIDLSVIRVEDKFASRCLYITGVTARVSEDALEAICAPLGLEINPESRLPWLGVFICQHTHRPRGDASAVFDSEQSAQHAIEELHNKIFINTRLRAQPMSSVISKIVAVQFDGQWSQSACLNTNCYSSVNLIQCRWCSRGPAFSTSGSLHEEQWVCNICRTANDPSASFCIGCHPATHFSPSAAKLPKHYFQQCFSR